MQPPSPSLIHNRACCLWRTASLFLLSQRIYLRTSTRLDTYRAALHFHLLPPPPSCLNLHFSHTCPPLPIDAIGQQNRFSSKAKPSLCAIKPVLSALRRRDAPTPTSISVAPAVATLHRNRSCPLLRLSARLETLSVSLPPSISLLSSILLCCTSPSHSASLTLIDLRALR